MVTTELEVLASGLVRLRAGVRNTAAETYEVAHLEPALPVPAEAAELLDMAGRHTHERTPQRRPFDQGQWVREAWGGRPGHDAATVMCAGHPGFGFRAGRVWGVHLAWSGNQVLSAEHSFTGWRLLRGGELLLPGEVRLGRGEEYTSPWLVGSWGDGLDAFSARFHRQLRSRPEHPHSPRKVLLNTWEAVLFDHDLDTLRRAGREGGRHRHRAVRARRRVDAAPARRPGGAGGLVRRRGGVARRPAPAGGSRARPRHGLRAVVRARDGQPRLGPRPGAPRVALRDRPRPRRRLAAPAHPRPRPPRGLRARPRSGCPRW